MTIATRTGITAIVLILLLMAPGIAVAGLTPPDATVETGQRVEVMGRVWGESLNFTWYEGARLEVAPDRPDLREMLDKASGSVVVLRGTALGPGPAQSSQIQVDEVLPDAVPDQLVRVTGQVFVRGPAYGLKDERGMVSFLVTDPALQQRLLEAARSGETVAVTGRPLRWSAIRQLAVMHVGPATEGAHDTRLSIHGQVTAGADGFRLQTPVGKAWNLLTPDSWHGEVLARAAAGAVPVDVWGRYQEGGTDLEVTQVMPGGPLPAVAPAAAAPTPVETPVDAVGAAVKGGLAAGMVGLLSAGLIWGLRRGQDKAAHQAKSWRYSSRARKPKLVSSLNGGERELLERLKALTAGRPVHIAPKMRVVDVVEVSGSALDRRTRQYAFMAHFDFVLIDLQSNRPICALELDGRQHATDAKTIERDRLKDFLCGVAGFPLVRVKYGDWEALDEVRPMLSRGAAAG